MANDYYDNSTPADRFQAGVTARGSEVDAKFDDVQAAFAKLPGVAATGKGFDEPIHVGNATVGTHAVPLEQALDKVAEWVNASIYDGSTEYSFSDVVIGSDGITYRFVGGSPATGDDPVTSNTGNWASYGGGIETLGTLTASMTVGQEVPISLSGEVETPFISATKEVVDTGLTNSEWNVDANGSNYDLEDFAYSVSITPSATTGIITLNLGSGTFSASDVGKRVVLSGGEAVLRKTDGEATVTTPLSDTSTVSAGSWSMYGLNEDGELSLPRVSDGWNPAAATTDNLQWSITDIGLSTPRGIFIKPDGTKMYISVGDIIYQYTLSTPFDQTTATYDSKSLNTSGQTGTGNNNFVLSNDGSTLIASSGTSLYQYTMTTPWDLSTASYASLTKALATIDGIRGLSIPDGVNIFAAGLDPHTVYRYQMSTAWSIDTAGGVVDTFGTTRPATASGNPAYISSLTVSQDGKNMGMVVDISSVAESWSQGYRLTEPYSLSSVALSGEKQYLKKHESSHYSQSGELIYLLDSASKEIERLSIAAYMPLSQHFSSTTNTQGQINTTFWAELNSISASETANNQLIHYCISTDGRETWQIVKNASSPRLVARNNAGTWQYNADNTYAATTWVDAAKNSSFAALSEAMTVTANRMNAAQLGAAVAADFPDTTATLDFAAVLFSNDDAENPVFDGSTINYDANAKQDMAIPGTDYEWDQPDAMTIRFTALTAQNFKARVI